ncbi:MAG TPA: hypothetical protein VGL75_12850 [Acidothermaceae bacterium]
MTVLLETPPANKPPLIAVRGRPVRIWLGRGLWAAITAVLATVALLGVFVIEPRTAPPLRAANTQGWIYPQDSSVVTDTSIGDVRLTVVPIRRGQLQGIDFDVSNPSRHSQTILGLVPGELMPGSHPGEARLAVATSGKASDSGHYTYADQAVVPPHQSRFVEIIWPSDNCVPVGGTTSIDAVSLRVQVFGMTRTENVRLLWQVGVSGTPASDTNDGVTC